MKIENTNIENTRETTTKKEEKRRKKSKEKKRKLATSKGKNYLQESLMACQALQYGKPKYINELLRDFHLDTSMTLRHSVYRHRLNEPRCNLNIGFRAFASRAPRLYNKLPEDLKNSEAADFLEGFENSLIH